MSSSRSKLFVSVVVVLSWGITTDRVSAQGFVGNVLEAPGFAVLNGDVNGDFGLDVSDPVYLLDHLFSGGPPPVVLALCGTSATEVTNGDINGDAELDISDPVALLDWLYAGGRTPALACQRSGDGDGDGAGGRGNPNPRVVPIDARPFGRSYGEWAGEWWQWALEIGAATNPVADETGEFCDVGQTRKVWFLAGTFGGFVERTCVVPEGTALFVPMLNVVSVPGFCEDPEAPCETEEEVRADANAVMDQVSGLELVVDGVELDDLLSYRAESPAYTLDLPEGDLLGLGPVEFYPAVADGYWVILAPLPPGEHSIEIRGEYAGGEAAGGFETEVIYHLIVD